MKVDEKEKGLERRCTLGDDAAENEEHKAVFRLSRFTPVRSSGRRQPCAIKKP